MPTLSGPEYLNGQFSVAADGTISLTTAPLPIGGGSMTGPIMLPAGTAAANSVQIVNPGTGMFGIAAGNQLAFATSGVERVRIDNNGNVGINTTTPAAQLDIAGPYIAATGNEIVIQATGTQTVASTGALIAGNLSPTYNAASGTLNVLMGLNAAPGNSSTGTVTTLTGAVIQPQNFAGGTVGTMRGVFIQPSNNAGGTVSFMYGLNSTVINGGAGQTTNLYGLYTRTNNTNAAGVVTNAYGLYIDTAVSTGTITNKWGVYQADATTPNYFNGNVGIGTTGPGVKLTVVDATQYGGIQLRTASNVVATLQPQAAGGDNGALILLNGGTTYTVISAAGNSYINGGNVGIGTTTPGNKLQVSAAAGAAVGVASFITPSMAVGQQVYLGIGTAVSSSNGFAISYNHDTAPASRVLGINSFEGAFGTGLNINAAGNVGIGTAAPGALLHVRGTAATGGFTGRIASGPNGADTTTLMMQFTDFAAAAVVGAITRNGTNTVAYGTASDARLKADISDSQLGIEELMQVKVRDFTWKVNGNHAHGLVAQEVAQVYPHAVHEGGDDPDLEPWMLDYGRLTPLLIKGIQQQQEMIGAMSAQVAALQAKVAALESATVH